MKQLTQHTLRGGCRGYDSDDERTLDIIALQELGYNHFTTYRDTEAKYALSYGCSMCQLNPKPVKRPWTPKPGNMAYDCLH